MLISGEMIQYICIYYEMITIISLVNIHHHIFIELLWYSIIYL